MFLFIFGLIVIVIGVAVFLWGFAADALKAAWFAGGLFVVLVGSGMIFGSTYYSQGVGDVKVITAAGKVKEIDSTSGASYKAPWARSQDWDTLSQKLTFVGSASEGTPQYAGGTIDGYEVTASVKGGSQANIDVIITYSLDPTKVEDLYNEFRSQRAFTENVLVPRVLGIIRQVPSGYTPIEFRGDKRGEAQTKIEERLIEELKPYGITIKNVDIQRIAYRESVENSIQQVEEAQQLEAKAQANKRAAQVDAETALVKAQGEASAAVAAAQGQADANALLTASLTPQVLQQRYIDALKAGTVFVVPEGATPMVSVP